MIYQIELENGDFEFINERIIMKIVPIKDRVGFYHLIAFNGHKDIIKSFRVLR